MPLWNDVQAILARLAQRGWRDLLLRHGLDILAPDLKSALLGDLAGIDRSLPGFADFAATGRRGIEPGDPARSLLYHTLASPLVHPDSAAPSPQDYPTIEELDTVENLIYSLAGGALSIADLIPAVFAYEYRHADRTPHRSHADMVFARAGIARNGTLPPSYDPVVRAYANAPVGAAGCCVTPARYGVFLARRVTGRALNQPDGISLMGKRQPGDAKREFLMPVHKLFSGTECLPGTELKVTLRQRHVNEKLRRACTIRHPVPVDPGFNFDRPPFVIVSDDLDPGSPVRLAALPGSAFVQPTAGPLIKEARQVLPHTGAATLVTFQVPEETSISLINRRYTSLRLADDWSALAVDGLQSLFDGVFSWLGIGSQFPRPRNAPEFMNIRHQVDSHGNVTDMRQQPGQREEFLQRVEDGGYKAAMFVDGCADGCVGAEILGLAGRKSEAARPAFSIVAPPDFFPNVDQIEVDSRLDRENVKVGAQFKQGGPDPLCYGRLHANPDLEDPVAGGKAFSDGDQTHMACVAAPARGAAAPTASADIRGRTSYLPDASSNVFAPGWDVTYAAKDDGGPFYATYGLGSPFPEDVKLCAAANSFWPAVSPDAARTFGRLDSPTAIPLLDSEIGYHPGHPWVVAGKVVATRGWDGEQGPFLAADGRRANYADIERVDYVANMLDNLFSFTPLTNIDADDVDRRMEALRLAVAEADDGKAPADTKLLLLSAEPVADWATTAPGSGLIGDGFRFVFAKLDDQGHQEQQDVPGRLTCPVAVVIRARVDSGKAKATQQPPGAAALALYDL